jgi:hypothetical protein
MTKRLPQDAERRLLDYGRGAAYLGVSLRQMKILGGPNGQIPRVEIGHRVLFDKADLDAYIERAKRAS